jgi:hypothetical protein
MQFVGGVPPHNGDVKQWFESARSDPMPVRYTLIELSDVFDSIDDPYIKRFLSLVKSSYIKGLDNYCYNTFACKKPI